MKSLPVSCWRVPILDVVSRGAKIARIRKAVQIGRQHAGWSAASERRHFFSGLETFNIEPVKTTNVLPISKLLAHDSPALSHFHPGTSGGQFFEWNAHLDGQRIFMPAAAQFRG